MGEDNDDLGGHYECDTEEEHCRNAPGLLLAGLSRVVTYAICQ